MAKRRNNNMSSVFFFVSIISMVIIVVSVADHPTEAQGATLDCDSRYVLSKTSYVTGSQRVSWFQAFVLCKQNGMELATIMSSEEQESLEKHLRATSLVKNNSFGGLWIGGTKYGASGSDFVWLSYGRPVIYRKFAQDQPDNAGNNENCLEVVKNAQGNVAWNDNNCDRQFPFVCQIRHINNNNNNNNC